MPVQSLTSQLGKTVRALKPAAALASAITACSPHSGLRPEVLEAVRSGTTIVQSPEAINVPMVGGPTLPLVDVMINGKGPFRFLIDLGGNVVSIRDDVAKQVHLKTVQALSERRVVTSDITIGATTFKTVSIVSEPVLDVQGVIGFNLFRRGLVVLDYPAQRFEWKSGSLPPADGMSIVPYQLRERMPYVQTRFANRSEWANLDTGARLDLVVPAKSEGTVPTRGAAKPAAELWNQAEGRIRTREAPLEGDLAIGGTTIEAAPKVTFSPALDSEILVGSGALRKVRLTLDTSGHRLKIERSDKPPAGAANQ